MGVLKSCKPRKEVLQGDLDDAVFAADFGNLVAGKAPRVYGNAKTFFQNTHPAKQLCKVVETVFERLADAKESGATIQLSTGFGTHNAAFDHPCKSTPAIRWAEVPGTEWLGNRPLGRGLPC